MTKRWNTQRIAIWGLLFGVVYTIGKAIIERDLPAVWNAETTIYMLSMVGGGAIGGAILFAIVSGLRNLILRAK